VELIGDACGMHALCGGVVLSFFILMRERPSCFIQGNIYYYLLLFKRVPVFFCLFRFFHSVSTGGIEGIFV
jgi:hypothetical protein